MYFRILVAVLVCVALPFAQTDDSIVRQTLSLTSANVDEIKVGGGFDVSLTQLTADNDHASSVVIETTAEAQGHIVVNIENGHVLSISTTGGFTVREAPRVYIRFIGPLRRYTVNGGGRTFTEKDGLSNPKREKFVLEKQGAVDISLKLNVHEFEANLMGAGDIQLSGEVREQAIFRMSGAGEVDALELATRRSIVDIRGAGTLRVAATDDVQIKAQGASHVFYRLPQGKQPSEASSIGVGVIERVQ